MQYLRSVIPKIYTHIFIYYCRELIHEIHKRGKEVYLISGGFRSIIEPVARDLVIPTANVYANKLKFYYDGKLPFF